MRSFRFKLRAALDEIRMAGVIVELKIIDDIVSVTRWPTPSQQRYLSRQE
jgi:hypothetical protein